MKNLLRRLAKTGKGVARLAALEIKERVRYNAPSATQPANRGDAPVASGDKLPLCPELSVVRLRKRLDGDTPPQLLDCREVHEWEAGYIEGSVHIPMNELPDRVGELDTTLPVIVYCLHGMRSAEVASWLKHDQGFADVRSMEGGIVSWYAEFDQERIVVVRSEDH